MSTAIGDLVLAPAEPLCNHNSTATGNCGKGGSVECSSGIMLLLSLVHVHRLTAAALHIDDDGNSTYSNNMTIKAVAGLDELKRGSKVSDTVVDPVMRRGVESDATLVALNSKGADGEDVTTELHKDDSEACTKLP